MSRITKEIAETTAKALLKAREDAIKEQKNKLRTLVGEAVKSNIPSEVMDMYLKHPDYFNTSGYTRFVCPGFAYEYYSYDSLPSDLETPKIGTQIGNKILSLSSKISDAEQSYNQLKKDIEVALFAFRTYSNVEKEFPEAFALLPSKVSQSVMINIDLIRKSIA